jgi:hypothetical protein
MKGTIAHVLKLTREGDKLVLYHRSGGEIGFLEHDRGAFIATANLPSAGAGARGVTWQTNDLYAALRFLRQEGQPIGSNGLVINYYFTDKLINELVNSRLSDLPYEDLLAMRRAALMTLEVREHAGLRKLEAELDDTLSEIHEAQIEARDLEHDRLFAQVY